MITVCLFLVLIVARGLVVLGESVPWSAATPLALLWHDGLVVLSFAVFETCFRRSRASWILYGALCLHAVANVPVFLTLGTPITAPMVRGTGGALADSFAHHLTFSNVSALLLVTAAAFGFPVLLRRRSLRRSVAWSLAVVLGLVTVTGAVVHGEVETLGRHRHGLVIGARTLTPDPWPRSAPERAWRESLEGAEPGPDLGSLAGVARGRNVVLILLESAAPRFLEPYGAARDPMPNLTRWSRDGLLFENAYAVYPESIKGLWALLSARAPAMDTVARDYALQGGEAMPDVLRQAGYRTALFHSGRFSYLGMDHIIRDRGFETLVDAATISGEVESSFGVDEFSTVDAILDWSASLAEDERCFLFYLPVAGHHPYDTPEVGPFDDSDDLGAYHNALHYADRALARLRAGFAAQGRDEETLYIVLGDHGQAFGEHPGNHGHVFHLYEENVHVPLLLLFPGREDLARRVGRIASAIDLFPTVLELLGEPPLAARDGRSLLRPEARLALFFTDYSDRRVGLRDGPWKFILDLDSSRSWLYDLRTDPGEEVDLSAEHPDRVARFRQHLTEWCGSRRSAVLTP